MSVSGSKISKHQSLRQSMRSFVNPENPPPEGLINAVKQEHEVNEPGKISIKEQVLTTLLVLFSAGCGAALGALLSIKEASEDTVSWFALPGELFIRALECIVLPLVFVNVILAVIQMAEAGKAGKVGVAAITLYMCTTAMAATEGLIAVLLFQSRFSKKTSDPEQTFVRILCPEEGYTLVQDGNDLFCKEDSLIGKSIEGNFEIRNLTNFYQTSADEVELITFSDTLQDGIFRKMIPENIMGEFADGGFVGVVMFGVMMGAASQAIHQKPVLLVEFLGDINDILVRMVEWIISFTPIAVFSLIAGALAAQEDLASTIQDLGILVGTVLFGDILHVFFAYPALYFFITRENPFSYMKHMIPAQIFAFSCASSAATLPVTLRCVKNTGLVPDSIRDFVLPIGATINMDGAGIYFPCALVFLATADGLDTNFGQYILIVIVSTIGSAGAAPVPNSALVLLLTAYNTVYGESAPANFGMLFGVEWLIDRFQTAINVTGDALVARMVTKIAKIEVNPDKPTSELPIDDDFNSKVGSGGEVYAPTV